jgi:hypothetical protein
MPLGFVQLKYSMQKAGCTSILVTKQTRNELLMYTDYVQYKESSEEDWLL